jgi:hypothetical protein
MVRYLKRIINNKVHGKSYNTNEAAGRKLEGKFETNHSMTKASCPAVKPMRLNNAGVNTITQKRSIPGNPAATPLRLLAEKKA